MMRSDDSDRQVLTAHVDDCELCRADPPPLERIAAVLKASAVPVDAPALSLRTLARLQPALARRASAALWRKAIAAVLLALVPLPAVLAYDAYLLHAAYAIVSSLLPAAFAVYLIATYTAFLVLLFAGTYAAIPLLIARGHAPHAVPLG